ncbi:MAG: hypothetical protein ACE5GJ_07025 [Gemmatimonadota bacterium]
MIGATVAMVSMAVLFVCFGYFALGDTRGSCHGNCGSCSADCELDLEGRKS